MSTLPSKMKRHVLQANLSFKYIFDENFQHFKDSDIFFVASFVDPTFKSDTFDQLMTKDEAGEKNGTLQQVLFWKVLVSEGLLD